MRKALSGFLVSLCTSAALLGISSSVLTVMGTRTPASRQLVTPTATYSGTITQTALGQDARMIPTAPYMVANQRRTV